MANLALGGHSRKDSEIAPTGQLEAGTGFALPVSKVIMCSSVLASLVAFMLQ
ncbi:hypothetical protein JHK87_004432 [Glycine soja]|nr:hypothetical protein JHK87_004432 [Glycine soja]